jgi:hypothetical protein
MEGRGDSKGTGHMRVDKQFWSLTANFLSFLVSWGGVRLSQLGTSATNWPIDPPRMIDD